MHLLQMLVQRDGGSDIPGPKTRQYQAQLGLPTRQRSTCQRGQGTSKIASRQPARRSHAIALWHRAVVACSFLACFVDSAGIPTTLGPTAWRSYNAMHSLSSSWRAARAATGAATASASNAGATERRGLA